MTPAGYQLCRAEGASEHHSLGFLQGVLFYALSSLLAACSSEANAPHQVVDLGEVPPDARLEQRLHLPDWLGGGDWVDLQASCGCVSTKLLVGDRELSSGDRMSNGMQLEAVFEPRPSAGAVSETVRIVRRDPQSGESRVHVVQFRCKVTEHRSLLVDGAPPEFEYEAPLVSARVRIPLRRSLDSISLRALNADIPTWLCIEVNDGGGASLRFISSFGH
jgi:hypothetical protein